MRIVSAISAATLLMAGTAFATSFVMMSDEALSDQAAVIAEVSVLSSAPAPAVGAPSTDYLVLVERVLKGVLSGSNLVVRVVGGEGPDGWSLIVDGAPAFREDQRAILFLVPGNDGTYGILHLMMGAFHGVESQSEMLAVRDFSEAKQMSVQGEPLPEFARNFEGFGDWLADRSQGIHREADYFELIEASQLTNDPQFVLQKPLRRFFEFDTGDDVDWRINKKKQLAGSKKIWKKSLKTWRQAQQPSLQTGPQEASSQVDLCNPILFQFAGTTKANGGLTIFDDVNTLLWEDPADVSPGAFDCNEGGVIAFASGWWITGDKKRFTVPNCSQSASTASLAKKKALILLGADTVVNDGAKCFLRNKKARWAVFVHELGHCLGLGHSCGDGKSGSCTAKKLAAVMTANVQDGRDGTLSPFDRKQISKLY